MTTAKKYGPAKGTIYVTRDPEISTLYRLQAARETGEKYGLKLKPRQRIMHDYHPLNWQCGDHIRSCSVYNLKQGYKCKHCSLFRPLEKLEALGKIHGLIFNDSANHGTLKHHKWLCEEARHDVKASPNRVQQGKIICRTCKPGKSTPLTRKNMEDYAALIGYTYAGSNRPKSNYAELFYCRNGHPFKATLKYLKRRRCSTCNPKTPVCEDHKQRKLTISDRRRQLERRLNYRAYQPAKRLEPA